MTLGIAGGFGVWKRNQGGSDEIEYRYEAVAKGDLVRSISATGQIVPLTMVDLRSKAGGKIIKLMVEEGDRVKAGDVIALIDPSDTKAIVDQANADLTSAQARAAQARTNADLERINRSNSVREAQIALDTAKVRLQRTETLAKGQPDLSRSSLASAQASYDSQAEALKQMEQVDMPRLREDARGGADRARVDMDNAKADLDRQQRLFEQSFVAKSVVERAQATYEAARTANANAQLRLRTVENEIDLNLRTQRARVAQAKAALDSARTSQNQIVVSQRDLEEARKAVAQAELSLQSARSDLANIQVRAEDVKSAVAGTVRSRVTLQNAQVQLDSTTVKAPRDGVVTTKYLEEGTIIPPGTSTFSQGTAIVQLSDTTEMFVECAVDEADIAQVKEGQNVRVIVEAYPGKKLSGTVTRIFPSAATAQNITAIKVRVRVKQEAGLLLRPGMNATCEFLTLERPNVLILPNQAVTQEDSKSFVKIEVPNDVPKKVEVKLGEQGNEGYEVISGVTEGQKVVTAEINVAQMKEIQQRMLDAQSGGGGLAGGQSRGGRTFGPTGGGTAGGGGSGGSGGASRGGGSAGR